MSDKNKIDSRSLLRTACIGYQQINEEMMERKAKEEYGVKLE